MPACEEVLEKAGLRVADIDLYACVVGPGSFTGVRIGACAVRGMAHAAGKPCAAVDALQAIAFGMRGFGGTVCPMLDARRDQVYAAAFARGEERLSDDAAISLNEFLDTLPGEGALLFAGEAAPLHRDELKARFGERAQIAPSFALHVRPAVAAELAARMPREMYVSPEGLLPLYLRAPSAERARNGENIR